MRQFGFFQQRRQRFVVFNRGGADQHRLAALKAVLDVVDDGLRFFLRCAKHLIHFINTNHRAMRRDDYRFQPVNLLELERLGIRRAGHAGQFFIHAEIVLESNRRQRLVFLLDRHAFLGFHRLVQTFRPAPAGHQPPGKFIDDDHFIVLHHVVLVKVIQRVSAQPGINVMHEADVGRFVQAGTRWQQPGISQQLLGALVPGFGQQHGVGFFVHPVVAFAVFFLLPGQTRNDLVHRQIQLGAVFRLTGNNQRRARFVDQDRVNLVDNGKAQLALHFFIHLVDHVVAQVIKAEFVVGAVGDVRRVGGLLGVVRHLRQVDPDREAEKIMDASHHLRVAAGQVIVHRDNMHALARQRVEVGRQRRHQGFALAGTHLGDVAVVQHHAADQLHVVMAQTEHAVRRFAHDCKRFRQQLVKRLALLETRLEGVGFGTQVGVRELLQRRFQRVDGFDFGGILFDQPVVTAAKHFFKQGRNHGRGDKSLTRCEKIGQS